MKFHPGKILQILKPSSKNIISANASTQAVIEMWDENILTFTVAQKIASKAKKGDVVIVDYNPTSEKMQIPKTVITKILRGKIADETWKQYKEYLKKKKNSAKTRKVLMPAQTQQPEGVVPKSVYR